MKLVLIISFFIFSFNENLAGANDKSGLRIGIIGAGVSGLTAAHYLSQEGYKNITIFEKEERIGGKVYSQAIDGAIYELGAVWVFKDYKTIMDLVREFRIPLRTYPSKKMVLDEGGRRHSFFEYARKKYGIVELMKSYWRAKKLIARYPELDRPGLAGVSPELFENFHDFAIRNKVQAIAYMMKPFLVGCGYGYDTEVPALYYMKPTRMLFNNLVESFLSEMLGVPAADFQYIPGGYQQLWEKVASGFDVHLSEEVLQVTHNPATQEIGLVTSKGSFIFDKLIISTPPDATVKYLDTSAEEAFLFSKAKSYYYQMTAFRALGIPKNEVMFLQKATMKSNRGAPSVIGNPSPGNDIWLALQSYDMGEGYMTNDDLAAKIGKEVDHLGGSMGEVVFTRGLNYFFHYSSEDLQRVSPYDRLESLQGKRGTYYVGGLLNFESVEHSAQYAKAMVRKFFHQ